MKQKKQYIKPSLPNIITPRLMAVPLAFFSAATAAAAVAGAAVGAVAASKVMSAQPEDVCNYKLSAIEGIVGAQ